MFLNQNKLVLFSLCLALTICAAKLHDFDEYYEKMSSEEIDRVRPEDTPFKTSDCGKSAQIGPNCGASLPAYKWSHGEQKCVKAMYGSCAMSTSNNFYTLKECVRVAQTMCKFAKIDCSKRVSTGKEQCSGSFEVYMWNNRKNRCVKALYGGCHASRNNFNTLKDCRKAATPVCYN